MDLRPVRDPELKILYVRLTKSCYLPNQGGPNPQVGLS